MKIFLHCDKIMFLFSYLLRYSYFILYRVPFLTEDISRSLFVVALLVIIWN